MVKKKVNNMKTIKVTATDFGDHWAVECSVCNFVALVASGAVDTVTTDHYHTHTSQ